MQEGRESMVFIDFIFPILLDFFLPTVPYRTVRYRYRYRTVPYRTGTVRYGTGTGTVPYGTHFFNAHISVDRNRQHISRYCILYTVIKGFNSKEVGIHIFSGHKIILLSCIIVFC